MCFREKIIVALIVRSFLALHVVVSKSFRPDIQKSRQMEYAVRDI